MIEGIYGGLKLDEKRWKIEFGGLVHIVLDACENKIPEKEAKELADSVFTSIKLVYVHDPDSAIDILIESAERFRSGMVFTKALTTLAELTKIELPANENELNAWVFKLGAEFLKQKASEAAKQPKPETPPEESKQEPEFGPSSS
jgi:hypothetical protein